MEVDSGSCSSSEDEQIVDEYVHTASVKIAMDSAESAKIVSEAVKVDKEPARSGAVRQISAEGKFLIIQVQSKDPKSLSKSIANAVDMCELSQNTFRFCEKFKKTNGHGLKRKSPQDDC